jgi:hypothetical protein
MVGRFKGFTREAEPCSVFLYSLALCVMDLSDSAFYIHELCLQLAGLEVVTYTTDDLDPRALSHQGAPEKRRKPRHQHTSTG